MDAVIESLEQLFAGDSLPLDEQGHLAALAELFPQRPALLFLASEQAGIVAARKLGGEVEPEVVKRLARDLSEAAQRSDPCLAEVPFGERVQRAFGLSLPDTERGAMLAGLAGEPPHQFDAWLAQAAPLLKVAGRLAWRAVQTERRAARLRTQVQHLRAEQYTLKAAHSAAVMDAIEEHEKRVCEEQTRAAMEQLCAAKEAANQAKSQFLANMSHEIRSPLTAILGFTEVLRSGADQGDERERRDYLNTIHASAMHLLELINDLLDLSKIEAGRMEVERIACSPQEIAASVMSLMRARAKERGLTVTCEWPNGVPATIQTDPLRLKQLLMNLVANAIKFTHQGGVRLVCRLVGTTERPRMAFEVIDTGIGIPADKLELIFDAFVQADNSVTRQYGGTGLGLAISRRIAQALGGDIAVQSEVGKGSTFTATVDIGSLQNVTILPAPATDAVAAQVCEPAVHPGLSAAKVLLVEDGSTNRKLISLFLRRAGIEVAAAENGQIGVELAKDGRFDLILMDMQMPVMDGYTATRHLRSLGMTMPIIALTAHAMSGDEQKCLAAGCSAYLSKPVTAERLLQTLADAMASAQSPLDPRQPRDCRPDSACQAEPGEPPPLISTLPAADADFREIVEDFVDLLGAQLAAAWQACGQKDLAGVARIAHTIKGTAGSAGFDAFTEPAAHLEQIAKRQCEEQVLPALEAVERLAARIVVPWRSPAEARP